MLNPELLRIEGLSIAFAGRERDVPCLEQVHISLHGGEILGLVGESGSGKSTLCRAILRVLRAPAYIAGGRVLWKGRDIFQCDEKELNRIRWKDISLVVQSSLDALNPVMTVERQLRDGLRAHGTWTKQKEQERISELLDWVGLPDYVRRAYPFEMSGGMRQRVVIAMALSLHPQLLIMDEPTTALDVLMQAEILGRIRELQQSLGFAVILVTHDLPLALDFCDSIAVMRQGRIVEKGLARELRTQPQHSYTQQLLEAFPETIPG